MVLQKTISPKGSFQLKLFTFYDKKQFLLQHVVHTGRDQSFEIPAIPKWDCIYNQRRKKQADQTPLNPKIKQCYESKNVSTKNVDKPGGRKDFFLWLIVSQTNSYSFCIRSICCTWKLWFPTIWHNHHESREVKWLILPLKAYFGATGKFSGMCFIHSS